MIDCGQHTFFLRRRGPSATHLALTVEAADYIACRAVHEG
ncbi:hypothetical protein PCH70_29100 [Pseudomonas cichorii JBC1]|nr:hypothetical protein PCH70_29100 [Pseudomonas cichorii JBC1]